MQTKLQMPLLRPDVVRRPRLLEALRDALAACRLVLISAPAGYGKTTLLATLPAAAPTMPLAWVTLHQEDDGPVEFLHSILGAVQRVPPGYAATAQALLADSPSSSLPLRRLIAALVNDVLETDGTPFALVLDDLHVVGEPSAYAALDYLLEHLPAQMRVVIATRHDPPLPLARLRARGELAELRQADLRFALDESAAFLNEQLHLHLSPSELKTLHMRTEGWPAGLRLLAISLGRIADPTARGAFLDDLARTDRYVFEFLADEVLSRQEPVVQTFLLETSILAELTLASCRAVTGRADAGALLETLDRRNLFVVGPDDRASTYRYHALFVDFLRQRLAEQMPDRLPELHRRAAEVEPVPGRAIGHYLAAGLVPALRLAVERGVNVAFSTRLLEILGHTAQPEGRTVRVPQTGETLTVREIELLRLLAAGASNRAIAGRLVLADSTVKNHLQHIFRKLDVASRTQAIARARELGIA